MINFNEWERTEWWLFSIHCVHLHPVGLPQGSKWFCTLLVIFKRMLHSIHCIEPWTNHQVVGTLYSRSGITQAKFNSFRRMVKLTSLLFLLVAVRFFYWTTFISQKYKAQKDCCGKMASLGLTIATTSSQSSSPHPEFYSRKWRPCWIVALAWG